MKKTSIILLHALPDKKIKSLGNKALIDIGGSNLLDYQISFLKKTFGNQEIIVVGGFESKRLQKYISKKYSNIKYISHEVDDYTNIGYSIRLAMQSVSYSNIIIMNGNLFINSISNKLLRNLKLNNYIISTKQSKSEIGCIKNTNNTIEHCFFDLPNYIYDFIRIDQKFMEQFKEIILNSKIDKLYLFEIINLCINQDINFHTIDIDSRHIDIVDNNLVINKIIKKHKKYA